MQPKRKLTFEEIQEIFDVLDKNGDGSITHAEFIIGLKVGEMKLSES